MRDLQCDDRHRDASWTVFECNLDHNHDGLHQSKSGLLWPRVPGGLVPARVPILAVRYDGESTRPIREFFTVADRPQLAGVDYAPVVVVINEVEHLVYPGQYVLRFDTGEAEVFTAERYAKEWRAA